MLTVVPQEVEEFHRIYEPVLIPIYSLEGPVRVELLVATEELPLHFYAAFTLGYTSEKLYEDLTGVFLKGLCLSCRFQSLGFCSFLF
jgi:hypothetical protein